MRAYRILVLLFVVAGAAFIAAPAANAAPYPAGEPAGSVSDGTVVPGEQFFFTGDGFLPGETVSITITYANGNSVTEEVTAAADGTFSLPITPSGTGTITLSATGLTSGVVVTSSVQVLGDATDDGDDVALPVTGSSGRTLAIAIYGGVGAIVAGAAMLWLTTMRRRRAGAGDLGS